MTYLQVFCGLNNGMGLTFPGWSHISLGFTPSRSDLTSFCSVVAISSEMEEEGKGGHVFSTKWPPTVELLDVCASVDICFNSVELR